MQVNPYESPSIPAEDRAKPAKKQASGEVVAFWLGALFATAAMLVIAIGFYIMGVGAGADQQGLFMAGAVINFVGLLSYLAFMCKGEALIPKR